MERRLEVEVEGLGFAPVWGGRAQPWTRSGWLSGLLAVVLIFSLSLVLVLDFVRPAPVWAEGTLAPQAYRCDGDPLLAQFVKGPVDDPTLPDPSAAPVPVGGSVVLRWHGMNLQLPRTNNAGQASFSDGKWWWSLEDPSHPRFRQRQPFGTIEDYDCVLAE